MENAEYYKKQRDKLFEELLTSQRNVGKHARKIRELEKEIEQLEEMLIEEKRK